MITLHRIRREPTGTAYERLLRYLLEHERWFGLVWTPKFTVGESALDVRDDLAGLRLGRKRTDHWPGTQLVRQYAIVETYRCDPGALPILLRPGSLFSWLSPNYPEDLHFGSAPGQLSLITTAHEDDGWIASPKVARGVSRFIPLKKEAFDSKVGKIFGLDG